jgi:hypothetical protein
MGGDDLVDRPYIGGEVEFYALAAVVKHRVLTRHLRLQGCWLVRQGGRHEIWVGRQLDVPPPLF